MRLRRGSVVARVDLVPQELVKPLSREVASLEQNEKLDLSEIDTPLEFTHIRQEKNEKVQIYAVFT